MMDIRKVKKLIELLEESGISEIEISEGEESVRISRYPKPGVTTTVAPSGAGSGSRSGRRRGSAAEARRTSGPRPAGHGADGRHLL